MAWLEKSTYTVQIAGQGTVINVERGVKQGCRASPILFLAYMALICHRLEGKLGVGWCKQHLSIFADDTRGAWDIYEPADLDRAISQLATVIGTFEEMGMEMNDSKARTLLRLQGLTRKKARSRCTKMIRDQRHLCLEVQGQLRHIPLVRQAQYLGAIISYDNYEKLTVEFRIHQAQVRFWQLQKLLCGKHGLSEKHRLQMWRVTIFPCLLYAIDSIKLTSALLQPLHTFAMKNIRAITRQPVHLSRISDDDLLNNLRLPSVVDTLQATCKRNIATESQAQFYTSLTWLKDCQQALFEIRTGLTVLPRHIVPHACPICGVYFDNRRAVKTHIIKKHTWHQRIFSQNSHLMSRHAQW